MTDPCSHPAGASAPLFRAVDYISGEEFEMCRCGACGLVRTTPAPANIDAYYPSGYYGDRADRRFPAPVEWFQNALYRRRARAVERFGGKGAGRVLDIGCGRGSLLQAF